MILNTIKTNWRDIVAGIGITLAAALASDIITNLSSQKTGLVWLANVADVIKGASRFFAANLIAFIGLSVAWPTLNRFYAESFAFGWSQFSTRDRLITLFVVACVHILAASICIG